MNAVSGVDPGAARARLAADVVGYALGLSAEAILTPERGAPPAAAARQIVMHLMATAFGMSVYAIARAVGRDSSTVGHGLRKVEARRDDERFDRWVMRLEESLRAAPAPARERRS